MSTRQIIRTTVSFGAALLILAAIGLPAAAGGSWFSPVKDRYEPGDSVTLVGYTGGGAYGWIEDGPFFGHVSRSGDGTGEIVEGDRLPVGELTLEETDNYGYAKLRVSVSFELPSDSLPGIYTFEYCNADCSEQLGDLIGGSFFVGLDPDYPISREWPLDEPEIANLEDTALISGPGFEITAEQANETPMPETPDAATSSADSTAAPDTVPDRTTVAPAPVSDLEPAEQAVAPEQSNGASTGQSGIGLAVGAAVVALAVAMTLRSRVGSS